MGLMKNKGLLIACGMAIALVGTYIVGYHRGVNNEEARQAALEYQKQLLIKNQEVLLLRSSIESSRLEALAVQQSAKKLQNNLNQLNKKYLNTLGELQNAKSDINSTNKLESNFLRIVQRSSYSSAGPALLSETTTSTSQFTGVIPGLTPSGVLRYILDRDDGYNKCMEAYSTLRLIYESQM